MDIHPSARKQGIADEELLEVVTIIRDDCSELAIHAMRMRPKYRRLLPGG